MSHLLTEFALNVLGPRGMVDGGHGVQALAAKADGVAHLLLVDALEEPVSKKSGSQMLRHFPIGILQVPVDGVEVVDDGGAAGVAVRAQVAARLEQLVLHVLLGDLADLPLDLFRLGLGWKVTKVEKRELMCHYPKKLFNRVLFDSC